MSAARFVRWAHGGDVYEHVGNEGDCAVLRHPTITHNDPGGRLHGRPAEIRCPQAWLTPAGRPIPAAGPPAVVDAPAGTDLSPVSAGVSSPGSTGGTPVAVAVQPGTVVAVVSPSAAATPIAVGREDASRVSGTDRGHTTAAPEGHPARPFDSGNPTAPHRGARNTDPVTSVEAAESITDDARRHVYDLIIRAIFEHGPQTDWQLGQRLGLLATSAGKRRCELRDMGLIVRTEHRGPTETGPKKAWRWTLTAQGEQVAA